LLEKGGGRFKGEGDYRWVVYTIELILWGGVEGKGGGRLKEIRLRGELG